MAARCGEAPMPRPHRPPRSLTCVCRTMTSGAVLRAEYDSRHRARSLVSPRASAICAGGRALRPGRLRREGPVRSRVAGRRRSAVHSHAANDRANVTALARSVSVLSISAAANATTCALHGPERLMIQDHLGSRFHSISRAPHEASTCAEVGRIRDRHVFRWLRGKWTRDPRRHARCTKGDHAPTLGSLPAGFDVIHPGRAFRKRGMG
jgi:hypothetical protein